MSEIPLPAWINKWVGADVRKRFMISWAIVFGIIFGVTFIVFRHFYSKVEAVNADIQALSPQLHKIKQLNLTPQNQEEKARELQEKVMKESGLLIRTEQVSTLISTISNFSHAHGVTLKQINSLAHKTVEHFELYSRVPIAIKLEGDYPKAGDFVGMLEEELPYLFTWDKVKFFGGNTPDGSVSIELELNFYTRKKG